MKSDKIEIPQDAVYCLSGLIYKILDIGSDRDRKSKYQIVKVIIKNYSSINSNELDGVVLKLDEVSYFFVEAIELIGVEGEIRIWVKEKSSNNLYYMYDITLLEVIKSSNRDISNDLISP
jgi:hypothetical protein